MSLCSATVAGLVGTPGALAEERASNSGSSNQSSGSGEARTSTASWSQGLTYTVIRNDSLSRIASRVGVRLRDLLMVNGFTSASVIVPGQSIKLPDGASTVIPAASPSMGSASMGSASAGASGASVVSSSGSTSPGLTYTVIRNDSLSRIASKVGVRLQDLLKVNGFTAASVIVPGQIISLPAGAKPSGASAAPATSGNSGDAASDARVTKVIDFARAQVGKPYAFATAGPATYDCSGLTRAAYRQVGISLPHQSLEQSKLGVAVDWRNEPIRPGDLVFTFSTNNKTQISHVGVAISATQWIEAPNTGNTVRVSNLPSSGRIQAVRRFL